MGYVDLPLHPGKAPRWLFTRMVELSKVISTWIIEEHSSSVFIQRLSDPLWFQALSLTLGFDWHSSGCTTTTTGALSIALEGSEIGRAGGKGKKAMKTPEEIGNECQRLSLSSSFSENLVRQSRLCAKIDTSCIQDGYSLYHHTMFFDQKGNSVVVQQGLNDSIGYARRYHWHNPREFFSFEEDRIIGFKENRVLNVSGKQNLDTRKTMLDAAKDGLVMRYPEHHGITEKDLTKKDYEFFKSVYEYQPSSFEEFLLLRNAGPKKVRSLALISSLVYGNELDWKDPVKYSFAHGGKDGIPYPVDRELYDSNVEMIKEALKGSDSEIAKKALERLYQNLVKK